MLSNVIGRVKNTPLPRNHNLLPLFEAIINSIDSIEELGRPIRDGQIDIHIKRVPGLFPSDEFDGDSRYKNPIYAFEIIDNGIGFTDESYRAFNEADSMKKVTRGGKGVGRFIWLKAFERVLIESVFIETEQAFRRSFTFSLASIDGIQNHVRVEIDNTAVAHKTSVKLDGFKEYYESACPKSSQTIAQRIVEHCISYFLLEKMPKIYLHDDAEEIVIDLWEIYGDLVEDQESTEFLIQNQKFTQIHFLLHARGEMRHHISYCANNRVVKAVSLGIKIPNLPAYIRTNDENFIYAGYVLSSYLDGKVNQQRTDFDLLPANGFEVPEEVQITEIEDKSVENAKSFLKTFTEEAKVKKEQFINSYVAEIAPQFRHIVKNYPERLDNIPLNISENSLDSHLYEISRDIEKDLREEAQQLLEKEVNPEDENSADDYLKLFEKWWQEYNDMGKANLAKYILHRRVILHLLEKALNMQESGKYSREEVIHKIVFPLRATSESISYNDHNLWIIDEKLSYHHYLASDVQLKRNDRLKSESNLRPDLILFFNKPIAVADEESPFYSGIVIFEFKRPMRDDYSDEENPITQVFNYVKEIKSGKAKTKDGRPFSISASTPFYCYIISDLTPSLKDQAEFYSLRPTPDNSGYIGFNPNLGVYIEVISFDKLLGDAKKRNRILFDKLRILE